MKRAIAAGVAYSGAVFALGFALGVRRTLYLLPLAGPTLAVAVELPIILAYSWFACGRLVRRFDVPATPAHRLAMGTVSFALLLLGELAISVLLLGRSLAGHLALYEQVSHLLGLAGQIAFALFPALQARPARRAGSAIGRR